MSAARADQEARRAAEMVVIILSERIDHVEGAEEDTVPWPQHPSSVAAVTAGERPTLSRASVEQGTFEGIVKRGLTVSSPDLDQRTRSHAWSTAWA